MANLAKRGSPLAQPGTGLSPSAYKELKLPAQQMAFFNLAAKLGGTRVGGQALDSYVSGVRHVKRDRVFVIMRSRVKQLIETAPDFASAAGHKRPKDFPDLPNHPDSWKHRLFGVGNLQLCFAEDGEPWPAAAKPPTPSFSVDADIDLGRGLAHAVEWLNNNVFNRGDKTDQTLVYGLLFTQGITLAYTLDPRS